MQRNSVAQKCLILSFLRYGRLVTKTCRCARQKYMDFKKGRRAIPLTVCVLYKNMNTIYF